MKLQCPVPDCTYKTEDLTDASLLTALLNLHATAHVKPAAAAEAAPAPPKAIIRELKRPTISHAANSEDWAYFIICWEEYRVGSRLDGQDVVLQLLECCTEDLRRDLVHTEGRSLSKRSENEVLEAIKSLAVRKENVIASRAALRTLRQSKDEPIRSFAARIKSKARTRKYVATCPSCSEAVNYSEAILQDVLIQGIVDKDIQQSILCDPNQDKLLEDILAEIEAKEAAKTAGLRINQTGAYAACNTSQQQNQLLNTTCFYCGTKGHGKNSSWRLRKRYVQHVVYT